MYHLSPLKIMRNSKKSFKIIILKFIDFVTTVLLPLEKILTKKYSKRGIEYQPLFIISAPRAGSTLVYQYITNVLDLNYINNFTGFFPRVFFLCNVIFNALFKNKSKIMRIRAVFVFFQ
ncbi:MAG: hypothetical protein ACOCWG_05395, partial [bacterium]